MSGPILVYAVYVLLGASVMFLWRFWHDRKTKRRASEVLSWTDAWICGQGQITGIHWESPSSFRLPLRLRSTTFHNASVHIQLVPKHQPVAWLAAKIKSAQETLTFEADLDWAPTFTLELESCRLFARTRKDLSPETPGWEFEHATPFILTTRKDWQKEISSVISSLLSCPERQFLSVVFRQQSPHFSATLALDSIAPTSLCRSDILNSLRELATGASAPQI
jgi:hypothetical protein